MLRTAVIADDLTGAADAGVQFVRAGHRTAVAFWGARLPPAGDLDAVAVDTDSRALPLADAAARVAAVARAVSTAPLVYKKIDSTLRGWIGPEVRAALDGTGRSRAVVAPAFPAAARTTRDGVQYVDGCPVDMATEVRSEASPALQAHVPRLLAAAGFATIGVLRRDELVDAGRVAAAVRAHACVVADAEDEADLAALVRGVPDAAEVLWVGSAGLAQALGAAHPGVRRRPRGSSPPASVTAVLVAMGSANPMASAQVRTLAACSGVEDVSLSLGLLASGREDDAVRAAVTRAAAALADARTVVVHATTPEPPVSSTATPGLAGDGAIGRRIPRALGAVAARLASDGRVRALVLSGGETAVHVGRALRASGLLIEDEIEPGVPVSRLIGPRPYPVVTKAGAFGGPATLVKAVEALGGRVGACS